MDSAIYAHISTVNAITTITTNLYAGSLPQFVTMPALIYTRISSQPNFTLSGNTSYWHGTYQFDCCANTLETANKLSTALEVALLVASAFSVGMIEDKMNLSEVMEDESVIHRVSLTINLWKQN